MMLFILTFNVKQWKYYKLVFPLVLIFLVLGFEIWQPRSNPGFYVPNICSWGEGHQTFRNGVTSRQSRNISKLADWNYKIRAAYCIHRLREKFIAKLKMCLNHLLFWVYKTAIIGTWNNHPNILNSNIEVICLNHSLWNNMKIQLCVPRELLLILKPPLPTTQFFCTQGFLEGGADGTNARGPSGLRARG